MQSLKASPEGLKKIKKARKERDWPIDDFRWLIEASKVLEPDKNWDVTKGVSTISIGTWKRFLGGEIAIKAPTFKAFCEVLGLEWEEIADRVSSTQIPSVATPRVAWGEAPNTNPFYGRTEELTTLNQWIVNDKCRLVAVLGIGGIGKTSLCFQSGKQIEKEFKYVIWQTLRNARPFHDILADFIKFLSDQQETDLPETAEGKISKLIDYLDSSRCLLILDNAETIFRSGEYVGNYREGEEGYGELFKRIGESSHKSCLLLNSREKPRELASLEEGQVSKVRVLELGGVKDVEAAEILKEKGVLSNSDSEVQQLINRYTGNPLALRIVATYTRKYLGSCLGNFLQINTAVFGNISKLAEQQYNRLSNVEKEIAYWLAIDREPVSLRELRDDIISAIAPGELLDALESLTERSLVEKSGDTFTQQPVIMEFMINQFIKRVVEEIVKGEIDLFNRYALIKARAKDYIREEAQRVLILQPIIDRLIERFGTQKKLTNRLSQIISNLQEQSPQRPGYAGGNIINMLCQMQVDLTGWDFSNLTIRQAYLQGVDLQNVNFTNCNLERSVFSSNFVSILCVAFSLDGKLLAIGDTNGEIRVLQVADDRLCFTCKGHESWVRAIAFSPDGKTLASGSTDKTVKLWDTSNGKCLHTLEGHANWVWSVSFSSDSQIIASGSDDQTVKIWDVSRGKCLQTLPHSYWVRSVAFGSERNKLASASADQFVKLWDISRYECVVKPWQETEKEVRAIAFRLDEDELVIGTDDGEVILLNVRTGETLQTFGGHNNRVWSVAFSPQGNLLASGSADGEVKLWDIDTGRCLNTLQEKGNRVRAIAFSPDGKILAAGSDDQRVSLWKVPEGNCLRTLQGYTQRVWCVAFSPDGQMLVSGSDDQRVRLWDVRTAKCCKTLKSHKGRVRAVAFSPDGNTIASASNDQRVYLWDIRTDKFRVLSGHKDWVSSIAFSQDGAKLVSGGDDKTVRLWNVGEGTYAGSIGKHADWIWSVDLSADGSRLATSSEDNSLKLWDVRTGECRTLHGHADKVRSVVFSLDGITLVSGSDDKTVKLWDVFTGECRQTFLGHTAQIRSVTFSSDGQMVASGSDDNTVRLWNVSDDKFSQKLPEHSQPIWSVAFSPDGKILASGSEDETIKIWDVTTGKCIATLRAPRPYEGMDIAGVKGLTEAEEATLKALGAIEV